MADQSDMSAIQWVNDEITNEVITYGSRYRKYLSAKYILDAMATDLEKENYALYEKLDLEIADYLYNTNPRVIVASKPWVPEDDYDLQEYMGRLTVRNNPELQNTAMIKYTAKILNRIERNRQAITKDIPLRLVNVKLWARSEGAAEYGDTLRTYTQQLWRSVAPLNEGEPISYESVRRVADRDSLNYDEFGRVRGTDGR
ncbi:MAG: hypothetical protein IJT54_02685 [Candidatus Methanomethylophilaceae archaeon]|nr:hypothetical protein [Candidatus Methanomethylophilaceae archaeon]